MAQVRSPWRLLRPVLLAGAATLTWLTLSTSAATADSSADSGSLLGGVTSSVSSLSSPLTGTVAAPAPVPAPAPVASSAGLVQPVVSSLAGTADLLVTEAPVLDYVVPAGTVSAVTAPVAAVAEDATARLVKTVAPPLAEAVPVLETLLEPVTDLVDGVGPLPEPVGGMVSSPVEASAAGSVTTSLPASSESDAAPTDGGDALAAGPSMTPQLAASRTTAPVALAAAGMHPAAPGGPLTQDPSAIPSPLGPTSGAGNGAPASGSNGSAALLDTFGFYLPLPGAFRISGPSEHAPSPVSFDPGSSPD